MSNIIMFEAIKGFAYGYSPEKVAAAVGITVADAKQIQADHTAEIKSVVAELEGGGYIGK